MINRILSSLGNCATLILKSRLVSLYGFLFGVPLLGFVIAREILRYFDMELRAGAQAQFPKADPAVISHLSLGLICQKQSPELSSICATHRNLNLIIAGSLLAVGIGLVILIAIWLMGFAARTNRQLLSSLFKPALYLTLLSVVGLVLLHAVLAMSIIYYSEAVLMGRVHVIFISFIGLMTLGGIVAMVVNVAGLIKEPQTVVIGKIVSPKQMPELWRHVEVIAQKLGALPPHYIVVGLEPNFYVTEAKMVCLNGKLAGRTLYCSLPFCRILSNKEFSAIIGHELGHYKGRDTAFSQHFYPIYRNIASSIIALSGRAEDLRAIALLPAIAILSYFFESFAIAERKISRSRELVADQEGVAASDRYSMASALVKGHAFARFWQEIEMKLVELLQQRIIVTNLSEIFIDMVTDEANPETLQNIELTSLPHPIDRHPPLSVRLKALRMSLNLVSRNALNVQPEPAAIQLFSKPEVWEEEISLAYQKFVAQRLGIRVRLTPQAAADIPPVRGPVPTEKRIQCKRCGATASVNERRCQWCGVSLQ